MYKIKGLAEADSVYDEASFPDLQTATFLLYPYMGKRQSMYLFFKGTNSIDAFKHKSLSDGKEFACSAGDLGLIPGLGRFPGEGNGHPPQYSCLKNSVDREA